jgi:Galactose oxidase, central domain
LRFSLFAEGHVEEFIAKQKYKAKFTEFKPTDEAGPRPKPRSQAAFAFDESRQLIYMFGGSDDTNEFNDFWSFDVVNNAWTPIESMNGPSPRAGCKMVFDPVGNQLFIIGRKSLRGTESLKVRLSPPALA